MKINIWKKTLSIVLTVAILLSALCVLTIPSAALASENTVAQVREAVKTYVETTKNDITSEGLLAAAQSVDSSVTLDTANDFFIKHAIPGVMDNDTTYPLNIPGSDGAVAAVFGYNGIRFGLAAAFAHTNEVIDIHEVAVVGTSSGFAYDGSGNVTAYSGTADKIIIPDGYAGSMTALSDMTSVNNVKVVMINNTVALPNRAFSGWAKLHAVQFAAGKTWGPFQNHDQVNSQFYNCPQLKYVKLPDAITRDGYTWWQTLSKWCFDSCVSLENISMPAIAEDVSLGPNYQAFNRTAVRDFFLPLNFSYNAGANAYTNPTFTAGTRNVITYDTAMTFCRAAALAQAKLNEMSSDSSLTQSATQTAALEAITGSADSATFRNDISCDWNGTWSSSTYASGGTLTISYDGDSIPLAVSSSKTLSSLEVGYLLTPAFDPDVHAYSVAVPYGVNSLTVTAKTASGATLGTVTGNTALKIGSNTIRVPVTYSGGTVEYTINAERPDEFGNLLLVGNYTSDVFLNNETVWYDGDLSSLLEPNTNYEYSYSYIGSNVALAIPGATVSDRDSATTGGVTTVHGVFRTPFDLIRNIGSELFLSGTGTVSNITIRKVRLNLVMLPGAAVRFASPTSLRFETAVYNLDGYDGNATVKVGTLICPTDYLDGIDFTAKALDNAGKKYLDIQQQVWAQTPKDGAPYYLMRSALSNIEVANYSRAYSARSYADITYADGATVRVYSDYVQEDHSRSVYYVTTKALNDTDGNYSKSQENKLGLYKTTTEQKPVMYVSWQNDANELKVAQKYSPTQDFVMVMKKQGGNDIFNIATPLAISNTADMVSSNLSSATNLSYDVGVSDWFGPHIVTAVNGPGGGYLTTEFTGGSHNYNGNESHDSTATGRSVITRVVVNGSTVSGSYTGYANQFDIYWDTYVQAANTKLKEGNGREVLVEHHHMRFDGVTWHSEVDIEFLEDVVWQRYYGQQCVYSPWSDRIKYGDESWIALKDNTKASSKYCDTVVLNRNNDYLEMYTDNSYGIGNRSYVYGTESGIFTFYYGNILNGKAYFDLVGGKGWNISGGTVLSYRGHYKFYYSK